MTPSRLAIAGVATTLAGVLLLDLALGRALAEGSDLAAAAPPVTPPAATGTAAPKGSFAAAPGPNPRPAVASYRIVARFDATAHTIAGEAEIRWRNTARVAVDELWIHQYLQAFSHPGSLYLRDAARRHRRGQLGEPGGLTLDRLVARELGGVDLWPARAPHSPGDPDDDTDIRVPLPRAIAPGEELTLTSTFVARLPALVERTGYLGRFVFAGQWFPKLARLEPDGSWAHFAFHPQAEFYADFGDYDVSLDVPASLVIGATGERVEDRVDGDRRHLRLIAHGVHDFAWTAWDEFRERAESIDGVAVRLLYPRGHRRNAERTLAALRLALPRLSERYGRYPYSTLTVVHPPAFADAAGGMEYPTLITTGGPWFASLGTRAVESVTIHELCHQWFYGLVASNEHTSPVLDEGLTSYAEGRLLREAYGAGSALAWPGLPLSMDALRRAHAAAHVHDDVVTQPAPAFSDFSSLGALVYAKTAVTLDTIARTHGEAALDRALGRYAREHRFGHPRFDALVRAVELEVGPDAARQLDLALEERGWVNYVAEVPRCTAAPEFPPVDPGADYGQPRTVCRALVRRHGTLRFPVEIELFFADGSRRRERWNGEAPWIALEHAGPPELVAVHVDPDRRVPLDAQRLDDAATTRPRAATRTLERLTYLAAIGLGWLGP